jgi:hypothetical protein
MASEGNANKTLRLGGRLGKKVFLVCASLFSIEKLVH